MNQKVDTINENALPDKNSMAADTSSRRTENAGKFSLGVSAEDTKAMKKILEKMYESAEKITENLVNLTESDEYAANLFKTKGNVVNIGEKYEIKVRFSETLGSKKNFYDICEKSTGRYLCRDLFLFEAAEAIVKLLNRGENILGEKTREVVFYEQKYVKHRQDAAIFKKRLSKLKRGTKDYAICEAKYLNSREQALKAKRKIMETINNLQNENNRKSIRTIEKN